MSPTVNEFAKRLGIDLVDGRHDPFVAEAARRADVNLLAFPSWTLAELSALQVAQQAVIAEVERETARWARVADELAARGIETAGGLPVDLLCLIFECSPEQIAEILNRPLPYRWWWK